MVNRRQILKLSALGTASFAAPLAYSASNITMAYNTGNAIGSTSPKDLSDNARNLDQLVNGTDPSYLDRKGVPRKSWKGMEAEHNADQVRRASEFDADQTEREVQFNATMDATGYEPPIPYVPDILLDRTTKTVSYLGNEYRARSSFIPLTTSNWDTDEAKLKLVGDDSLRQDQANSTDPSKGAGMVGYTGRTVAHRLDERPSILNHPGAAPLPADSTAAFTAAYAATTGPIFVPEGVWYTTDFRRTRLYGPGTVLSNDTSFTDSGSRPIPKRPAATGGEFDVVETYGNFERAAGSSLIVNRPDARPQISGYSNDSQVSAYANRDHVASYIAMYGPRNQVITVAGTTAYTATSMTAPEIIAGAKIKIGMFVDTKHAPKFSGKVTAIDFAANKITIGGGWFQIGNASAGQIPNNGVSATINPADKIWGMNINLFIDAQSTAKTGTVLEIGMFSDGTHGVPVWGVHAVNQTLGKLDWGFHASGLLRAGLHASKDVDYGLDHDKPAVAAVRVQNLDDPAWSGTGLLMNNSYPLSTSYFGKIVSDGVTLWSIDSSGHRSSQRESAAMISVSAGISPLTQSILLCTNSAAITLTPTGNFKSGHVFEVRSVGAGTVTFTSTTLSAGQYGKFVYDGSGWIKLFVAS
jgi:hypothetical protein